MTGRPSPEQRQAAFVEIVKELAREDDFERLVAVIGRRACELVDGDTAAISLIEGDEIVYRGSWGFERAEALTQRRKIVESRARRVLEHRRAYATGDMAADPVWRDSALVTEHGFRAIIETPIVLHGEAQGVFGVLYRRPRDFSPEDVALLASLAEHTALALERTNRSEERRVGKECRL